MKNRMVLGIVCILLSLLITFGFSPLINRLTDGEVSVCLPFLQRQIELVKPKCIFLLGASAANALFDNADSISHLRGKVLDYKTPNGEIIPALCSYHPAYLLRSPQQKSKSWSDLLRLQRKLQEN